MDNETIAKDLVAAYLTKNKLPTPKDVAPIAKRLADFYKATKDKLNPENGGSTAPNPLEKRQRRIDLE